MEKSIKTLLVCISAIIIFVSVPVGKIVLDGYSNYKEVISNMSLEDKIKEIKSDKDYVTIENIDEDFLNAIVSVEDHRFYNHGAIDFISLTRATVNNIKAGRVVQGGSTITQQLAKNIYLNGERRFSRKVSELFIANELEKKYSKNEILELYVNIINYGNGYTGIKEASEGYFNREVNNLELNEATMLAGIPQSPEGYNPKKYYDRASTRQKIVLAAVKKYGKLNYDNIAYILALGYVDTYKL